MKLTTTLNEIEKYDPCEDGWEKLLNHLGPDYDRDAEINLLTILESNGYEDCLWALRATKQDSKPVSVRLAIEFAKLVLPIFEKKYPDDDQPRKATEAAETWLNDPTEENRRLAAYAAYAAYAAASRSDIQIPFNSIVREHFEQNYSKKLP